MRRAMRIGFGMLSVLVAAALIAGSVSIFVLDRDADDYVLSAEHRLEGTSYAIVSGTIEILPEGPAWLTDLIVEPAEVRIRASSADGEAVFVGIGTAQAVKGYLMGVPHHEVTAIDLGGSDVTYAFHDGVARPLAPGSRALWIARDEGPGTQTLDWSIESGEWTAVLMNADGTSGVAADVVFGAKVANIVPLAWGMLIAGAALALIGIYLIYRGTRRPEVEQVVLTPAPEPRIPTGAGTGSG